MNSVASAVIKAHPCRGVTKVGRRCKRLLKNELYCASHRDQDCSQEIDCEERIEKSEKANESRTIGTKASLSTEQPRNSQQRQCDENTVASIRCEFIAQGSPFLCQYHLNQVYNARIVTEPTSSYKNTSFELERCISDSPPALSALSPSVSRVEIVEQRHDKIETNVDDLVQRMSAWQSNVNVDTNDRGKTHNISKCFATNHLLQFQ